MNNIFNPAECLYRAIMPSKPNMLFMKDDGSVSSALYKDPNGCSVDRGNYRNDNDVVADMQKRLVGNIAKFSVKTCNEADILIKYLPENNDIYHSELHRDINRKLLSKSQAKFLAKNSTVLLI